MNILFYINNFLKVITCKKSLALVFFCLIILSTTSNIHAQSLSPIQNASESAIPTLPEPSLVPSLTQTPIASSESSIPIPSPLIPNPNPTTPPEQLDLYSEGWIPSAIISQRVIIHKLPKITYSSRDTVRLLIQNATFNEIKITLLHENKLNLYPNIQMKKLGLDTEIRILPSNNFIPGKYLLNIEVDEEMLNQEYYWGTQVVNTNKSVYLPQENVTLSIINLDANGDLVCNGEVDIYITDPEGIKTKLSTKDGSISSQTDCLKQNNSLAPDYLANFTPKLKGTYKISVQDNIENNTFTYLNSFEVQNERKFSVSRNAPTRVYPLSTNPVSLTITANEDFTGTMVDTIPDNFTVSELAGVLPFTQVIATQKELRDKETILGNNILLGLPFNNQYAISLGFGDKLKDPLLKKIYYDFGLVGHDGIDFKLPEKTSVISVDDGTVVLAKAEGDYGSTIVIEHSWGKSYYGHLSQFQVQLNQSVKKGQEIALSGSTGLTLGPHLHFGIKLNSFDKNNGYYGKIDPAPFLGLIEQSQQLKNSTYTSIQEISWNITLKKGEQITLGYEYTTPESWPQLYSTGPIQLIDSTGKQIYKDESIWNFHTYDQYTPRINKTKPVGLQANGKPIVFSYTDDNNDENIIINSDQKTYFDIGKADVYFSMTNTNNTSENIEIQAIFPEDKGEVKNIWKYNTNIPYEVDIEDYGPTTTECSTSWNKVVNGTSEYFQCANDPTPQLCSSLSTDSLICYNNRAFLGTFHKETRYKSDWQLVTSSEKSIKIDPKTTKLLPNKGFAKRNRIPGNFKVKKSTSKNQVQMDPGETIYIKMELGIPENSKGQFYIEVVGDNQGYGFLDPWWDTTFLYRKSIPITGAGTAGTDYQKQITVNYSSGGDVTCNSHCNADFGDIRFTASDGQTPLSFYQQSYTASSTSIFFVKVTDNISTGNNTTIYMYYGKSGATTTSSGVNTYLFFDDFSGDLSKWSIDAENTDTVAINSGALRHDRDSTQTKNSYFDTRVRTASYTVSDGVVEYSLYLAGSTSSDPRIISQFGYRVNSLSFTNGYAYRIQNSSGDGGNFEFVSGAWNAFGTSQAAQTGNAWHTVRVTLNGSSFTGYVDGGSGIAGSDATKSTADYLVSHVHGVSLTASSYVLIDNVRVRKFSATEPTFGTIGSEVTGLTLDKLMRHGKWFFENSEEPFSF